MRAESIMPRYHKRLFHGKKSVNVFYDFTIIQELLSKLKTFHRRRFLAVAFYGIAANMNIPPLQTSTFRPVACRLVGTHTEETSCV